MILDFYFFEIIDSGEISNIKRRGAGLPYFSGHPIPDCRQASHWGAIKKAQPENFPAALFLNQNTQEPTSNP
ncbi:MAG TPA: hypothetical protein ENJ95_12700 [Bacteroidetes bacterium]|nr:hypothetical protein [Bacteroidota bacterium]